MFDPDYKQLSSQRKTILDRVNWRRQGILNASSNLDRACQRRALAAAYEELKR